MNYAKVGLYVGAVAGLVLFVAAWLLPVSFIGGVSGSKIQEYVSGNSYGFLTVIFMVLIVLVSGAVLTAFSSFVGWVGGTAIGALKSSKTQTESEEVQADLEAAAVKAE